MDVNKTLLEFDSKLFFGNFQFSSRFPTKDQTFVLYQATAIYENYSSRKIIEKTGKKFCNLKIYF